MFDKYIFLIILLLISPFSGFGQSAGKDTVLKGSVIEVIQSYKPQVRQAPKPEWIPQLPPIDTFHRVFSYVVPQQSLYYSYHSDPFKPLVLGKDTIPLPFANYIKIGGGNLSTMYLDAGIGSLASPDYETFFHVHHISQYGNIKYQQTALTGIETEGMWHKDNNEWHANLNADRNQYYYYGYNHNMYNYTNSDSLNQTFYSIKAIADYKRKDIGESKLDYHPVVNASYYGASFNTHETSFGLSIPFTYDIDTSYQARVAVFGNFTQFKTDSPLVSNNVIKITPGISVLKGDIYGHADIGFAVANNGTFYLLPDIEGGVNLPVNNYKISGGWLATLRQNTYEQLTTENPYVFNNYQLKQTRIDELFVNFMGNYGSLQYSGRASWCNFNALPTYLDTMGDRKQFSIVYDNLSAISLQFSAKYLMARKYIIGIDGTYYNFYQGTTLFPWHIPNFKLNGNFAIKALPNLTITAYMALLTGIHAIDNNNNVVTLKTIFDLGINGEYQLNSRFYLFLQASNIFNGNYQRWYGYDSYGLNIYGGLRVKY